MGTKTLDACLIKSFYNYNLYNKYYNYIDLKYIKETNRELFKLYQALQVYHEKFPDKGITSTVDFELFFYTQYPATPDKEREILEALFRQLNEVDPDLALVEDYLNAYRERQEGHKLALLGLDIAEGRKTLADAQEALNQATEASIEQNENPFVSSSLQEIYDSRSKEGGMEWPLEALRRMLGPIRRGDYGFIFARPETGKTTFLAHSATHMAATTPKDAGPIVWFNNEQEGHTVVGYCYRAALGLTNEQLYANIEENQKRYLELTADRIRVYDDASIHRRDVEAICKQYQPALVIFDQLDKIKGFDSDRQDITLGSIYQWARELAKTYCPVIGVCQAGESGSNKMWLTMEDVVNAKTSKQAEADWILGIGKVIQDGYENVRYLHLCKNKLTGNHGKAIALIEPAIARYRDVEDRRK